ncbi:MAG TPA: hypothetical protein VNO52_15835 [Methylomirabilota bacterium]|nr:hypothetical protein [Methylomirabilota bacterium]
MSMDLRAAYDLSLRIKAELAPFCEQIEVVGSIRRARPHVNDIDIVVLPKPGAREALLARATARTTVISSGPDIAMLRLKSGAQLDLYFARGREPDLLDTQPSNWGSIVLCRTGSKAHNIFLAQRAQEMGLKWETMRGIVVAEAGQRGSGPSGQRSALDLPVGKVIASETEEEIFSALNLEWIPPVCRER